MANLTLVPPLPDVPFWKLANMGMNTLLVEFRKNGWGIIPYKEVSAAKKFVVPASYRMFRVVASNGDCFWVVIKLRILKDKYSKGSMTRCIPFAIGMEEIAYWSCVRLQESTGEKVWIFECFITPGGGIKCYYYQSLDKLFKTGKANRSLITRYWDLYCYDRWDLVTELSLLMPASRIVDKHPNLGRYEAARSLSAVLYGYNCRLRAWQQNPVRAKWYGRSDLYHVTPEHGGKFWAAVWMHDGELPARWGIGLEGYNSCVGCQRETVMKMWLFKCTLATGRYYFQSFDNLAKLPFITTSNNTKLWDISYFSYFEDNKVLSIARISAKTGTVMHEKVTFEQWRERAMVNNFSDDCPF